MRLHVEALYSLDDFGRLTAVNDSSEAPAPRVFLGRTPKGNVLAFRYDLPERIVDELTERASRVQPGLDASPPQDQLSAFATVLSDRAPVEKTWSGPNYRFPATSSWTAEAVAVTLANPSILSPHLEEWLEDIDDATPMAAALHDDHAVSVCCSVRTSPRADEAGVETHPEFRGRGFALHAVAAWATAVQSAGRIPLYSTSWENQPSQRVAEKLGLIQYGSVIHVT
jgi:RimJ/RimL family protein N-acetyltransferase